MDIVFYFDFWLCRQITSSGKWELLMKIKVKEANTTDNILITEVKVKSTCKLCQ